LNLLTYHGNMVEVVDEEDGAQLLGLEGAWQLHEQVHAGVPHAVQVVIQLPILHHKRELPMLQHNRNCKCSNTKGICKCCNTTGTARGAHPATPKGLQMLQYKSNRKSCPARNTNGVACAASQKGLQELPILQHNGNCKRCNARGVARVAVRATPAGALLEHAGLVAMHTVNSKSMKVQENCLCFLVHVGVEVAA